MKIQAKQIPRAILAVASLLIIPMTASADTIVGSDHDFSGNGGWAGINPTGQGAEICVACHTPHNGETSLTAPLWNHELTTQTFTPYTSNTLDATVAQPTEDSLLCLSCHDGVTALDSFGGQTGANIMTGDHALGVDLSNDHPVSFTYDATLATTDGGLFDPTTTNSGLGSTIDSDLLKAGKVQCSSCHNPHDDQFGKFLLMSNAASDLCLTCHDK